MNTPIIPLRLVGTAALVALGLVACQSGPSESEKAALSDNARLKNEVLSRDSLIEDMTRSFGDIEQNLALLEDREKLVSPDEASLTVDQRQRIMRDIQLMNSLMKESRDRIADLTKRLDRSTVESGSLRKKLKALDAELASRDSALTLMKEELLAKDFKIEEVNQRLNAFELEMARREATIEQLGNEMHTAYYAVGSAKELEEKGVVKRDGGVLGIGRSTQLNSAVAGNSLSTIDTRNTDRIPLAGKKVELVTDHPAGSYEIVKEKDKLAYLKIKDPDAFWRLSHYLVAEVR
ncbi:MAG: hypothetical protein KF797_02640 [Flavobacteriales bacterium]|nr:hypothetical protein [Flavobacteriales bacterium]